MDSWHDGGMRGLRVALASAAITGLALGYPACATDLAGPELKPVTAAGMLGAIDLDRTLASRRLTGVTGNATGLASTVAQLGNANTVDLVQSGRTNEVAISQQGNSNAVSASQQDQFNRLDLSQQGNGNAASVSQPGGARASVIQAGDGHKADIYQTAASPGIVVRQSGVGTVVQTTQY